MNRCIKKRYMTYDQQVVKLSHYYVGEVIKICKFIINTTPDNHQDHLRCLNILRRFQKYVNQTSKKIITSNEVRGVLPIGDE